MFEAITLPSLKSPIQGQVSMMAPLGVRVARYPGS